jgi:hypothetical protein
MPNGKKMGDCGGQYVGEVSEALHRITPRGRPVE